MDPTTSTFISVGEEEKHKAYKHTRAGDNEGREDDEAYRGTSLGAGGDCGGSHTGAPTPLPHALVGNGAQAKPHGPRATAPKASAA